MEPIPSYNLPQWVKTHTLRLVITGLICAGLLLFFSWLESTVTYSHWQLTFHSPALNSLGEIAYRGGKLYLAVPEQGKSWVISKGQLSSFRRKHWLAIRVSFLNLLGFACIILAIITFKKRALLWNKLKQLTDYLVNQRSWQALGAAGLSALFILSIFPTGNFAHRWQPYKFLGAPPKDFLARLTYDLMTEAVIYSKQRLFYASLFTIPPLILKLTAIVCFTLLLLTYCPLPEFMKQSNFKNLAKPLCRPLTLLILASLILITAALPAYNHLSSSNESIAQLFQAKIFQQGSLAYPIQHSKEFFQFPFISNDNAWHSQFAPGYSFLLSLGLLARVPWLLNPLLAALTVVLVYKLASALYDQPTAILSCILLAASPLYLQTTAAGLQHTATAFFLCLGLFFYQDLFKQPRASRALLAGSAWGMSYLISPQTTLALTLPWLVYLASRLLVVSGFCNPDTPGVGKTISRHNTTNYRGKMPLLQLFWLLLPFSLALAALAAYNHQLTGRFFLFGYNSLFLARLTQVTQPLKAGLTHTGYRLEQINYQLLGPWLPAFVFICTLPLWRKQQRWDRLLLGSLFTLLATYAIFFTNQANFSNFLLGILPLLIILSARGILLFPELMSNWGFSREKTTCFLLLILLLNLGLNLRANFRQPSAPPSLNQLVRQSGIKKAVIFLDPAHYPQGFVHNSPALDNDIIYARNLGQYNYKLQDEFPRREHYLYQPQLDPGEEFVKISP